MTANDDQLPLNDADDSQPDPATRGAAQMLDGAQQAPAVDGSQGDDNGVATDPVDLGDPALDEHHPLPPQHSDQLHGVDASASGPAGGLSSTSTDPADPPSPAEAAPPTSGTSSPPQSLYFLTNRMNLNGILSSRLVAPRESFQKYYTDLLEQTPGWVPLLRQAPTTTQIEAVTTERGSGAPVIIEFPLAVAGKAKPRNPVVHVPAVALSHATAIHLASERDLREHRARGYSNVHPHDHLLRVTPELFESGNSASYDLAPATTAPTTDWRRIDRIRGAVNAAVRAAGSGEQLALAAALVGAAKIPPAVTVPTWLGWSEIDDHATPDERTEPDGTEPDHVGFRAVYNVLGDRDVSEAWSPNDVLDSVTAQVRDAALDDAAADAIIRNLGRVRAIVNVEVDFEPFRPTARALVSAKALLLVLLRQELGQLLTWSQAETGADDATRIVAALLAGRLRGLSREAIELRSLELDDLTAAWATRVAHGRPGTIGKVQLVANTRGTSLKIDGVEVAKQRPLLPDLSAKYQKTPDAKKEATRIKVSRAMGWPVEHRIHVPAGASVENGDSYVSVVCPDEVTVSVSVDEDDFVRRLGSLTGEEHSRASEAFTARR